MSSSTTISESETRAWCIVYGLESAAIILGNILIMAAFAITKSLHKKTYYLLISLAVADLLVGAVALPLYIHLIGGTGTNWWNVDNHVTHTFTAMDIFTAYASIFFLVMIALERLYAVLAPLQHANLKSYVYFLVIAFVWVLASLLSILSFLREKHIDVANENAFFIFIMIILGLSMLTIIVAYSIIGVVVMQSLQSPLNRENDFEKRLACTLLILSLIFIVSWMPFKVINYIFYFNQKSTLSCGDDQACVSHAVYVTKLLHYANSLANPIVYALRVPDFRKGVRRILCACYEDRLPENPPLGKSKGIDNVVSMQSIDTVVPSMFF